MKIAFPEHYLMSTDGVAIENAWNWKAASAVAVGVGSELMDKKAIAEERYQFLTERA